MGQREGRWCQHKGEEKPVCGTPAWGSLQLCSGRMRMLTKVMGLLLQLLHRGARDVLNPLKCSALLTHSCCVTLQPGVGGTEGPLPFLQHFRLVVEQARAALAPGLSSSLLAMAASRPSEVWCHFKPNQGGLVCVAVGWESITEKGGKQRPWRSTKRLDEAGLATVDLPSSSTGRMWKGGKKRGKRHREKVRDEMCKSRADCTEASSSHPDLGPQ